MSRFHHRPLRAAGAAIAACAALLAGAPAQAADVNVGVSIGISQPGVYGRIDIGNFPQPQVIVGTPVIVAPQPVAVIRPEPVYLWVPPGHRKNWKRYCGQYGACGTPVYFVRDDWYDQNVMKGKKHKGDKRGQGGHGGQGKGKKHDD